MAISTGAAILASTVASSVIGNRGSDNAVDAQRDASAASVAEQRRQHDLAMERSQPFYEGSLNAYNSLLAMEGLGGGAAPSAAPQQSQQPSILNRPGTNQIGSSPSLSQDVRNLGSYYGGNPTRGSDYMPAMSSYINHTDDNGMTVTRPSMMPLSQLSNQMNSRAPVLRNRNPSIATFAPPPRMR